MYKESACSYIREYITPVLHGNSGSRGEWKATQLSKEPWGRYEYHQLAMTLELSEYSDKCWKYTIRTQLVSL